MINKAKIKHVKNHIANLKVSLPGRFLYYCIPFRKKVVLQNIQQVFQDQLNQSEQIQLAKGFYSHLARSLRENLQMRLMTMKQLKKHAEIKGDEHLWQFEHHEVNGAILITGHFGNWEFAPIAGMLHFPQFKNRFYFVRKTLVNKKVEKLLFRRYYAAGLNVIPKKNSLNKVCDALETHNAVVFVMDQHASIKAKDGIFVDFFGKKAGTFKSPAIIAQYTNVPVIPCRSYRRKDGKHVLEFLPAISWQSHENPKKEIELNTRAYNEVLEDMILDYPEQWLWMHRRWKTT